VYIGLRDLDTGEKEVIAKNKIKAFTMHVRVGFCCSAFLHIIGVYVCHCSQHVDKYGIGKIMEMTLDHLAKSGEVCVRCVCFPCVLTLFWGVEPRLPFILVGILMLLTPQSPPQLARLYLEA
jgi:hypothetical protein